jgi:hypothetical protein
MRNLIFSCLLIFYSTFLVEHYDENHRREIASLKFISNCSEKVNLFFSDIKSHYLVLKENYIEKYFFELKDQGPIRLFLKNQNDKPIERKYLFLSRELTNSELTFIKSPILYAVQYIPRTVTSYFFGVAFEFHPISNLNYYLIKKPFTNLTKKIFKEEKELSLLVTTPIGFGVIWVAFDFAYELYDKKLNQKKIDLIEENKEKWDNLIENDFSLNGIKELLQNKKITPMEARKKAYMMLSLFNDYYSFMNSKYANLTDDEKIDWAIKHPLFLDIKKFNSDGITRSKQYIYLDGFTSHPSKEQILALIDCMHSYYMTNNIIFQMVNTPDAPTLKEPSISEILNQIIHDPFYKKIHALYKENKITKNQFTYKLQEDCFWQERFKKWEILKIRRQKISPENNQVIPVTLNDIRNENLNNLFEKK